MYGLPFSASLQCPHPKHAPWSRWHCIIGAWGHKATCDRGPRWARQRAQCAPGRHIWVRRYLAFAWKPANSVSDITKKTIESTDTLLEVFFFFFYPQNNLGNRKARTAGRWHPGGRLSRCAFKIFFFSYFMTQFTSEQWWMVKLDQVVLANFQGKFYSRLQHFS